MERRTPHQPAQRSHGALLLLVAAAAALGAPSFGVDAFGVQPQHRRSSHIGVVTTRLQSSYDPNYYYDAQKDFSPTGNSKYPMIPDHIKACSDLTDQLRRENGPPPQFRNQISTSIKACSDLTDRLRQEQGPPPQFRAPISTSIKACSDLTDELRALHGPPTQYRNPLSREVVGASTFRDTRAPGHNGLIPARSTVNRDVVGASTLRDDLFHQSRSNNFQSAPAAPSARPDVFLSEAEQNVMIRDYPQRAATEIPPALVPDEQGPPIASAAIPQQQESAAAVPVA